MDENSVIYFLLMFYSYLHAKKRGIKVRIKLGILLQISTLYKGFSLRRVY